MAKKIDPLTVDFAALRTLQLVFSHGSFSRAADNLEMNQSTISYTVNRLRKVFDDPLFVRQGGGVTPTERCKEIVGSTKQILDEFEMLVEPAEFNPASATATITISSNHYERVTILPMLMKNLRDQAPGMRVNMIQSSGEGGLQLKRGECDLLISPVKIDESGIYRRKLFDDYYVCVMDQANALATRPMNLQEYTEANHALVTYGGGWRSFYLVEIERLGRSIKPVLRIPSPEDLSSVLLGTDMISTIPSRLARTLRGEIEVCECPCPAKFEVDMYWTSRSHHSAMHKWVRQLIGQTAQQIDD